MPIIREVATTKKISHLLPRRKQEIFQNGVCYRVANKKFFKLALATASQT